MLYECVEQAIESNALASQSAFHPLPTIDERDIWDNVDPEVRAYYDGLSAGLLKYQPSPLPASLYADYFLTGNRSRFEKEYFDRRRMLLGCVMAECIENNGRYIKNIIDIVWAICEESTWVIPAHMIQNTLGDGKSHPLPETKLFGSYIDLFAAETASVLAWTMYLVGARLKHMPQLESRVQNELQRRILDTYVQHPEMSWTGFNEGKNLNNWTPWIYSNLLCVLLLCEKEEQRRNALSRLIAKGMDAFIATYAPDGGCDEGPGYYDKACASLLDTLQVFDEATNGKAILWNEPIIQNMARYIMQVHIDGTYYVNCADSSCRTMADALALRRSAVSMNDETLIGWTEYLLGTNACKIPYHVDYDSIYRKVKNIITFRRRDFANVVHPQYSPSHYFDGIELAVMRQDVSGKGLFLAAKGGNNAESHNHNDIGNYIIYLNGEPFIIDVGVGTYSRRTFSAERYDIWTMQSRYHNTAIIGERDQLPGLACAARDVSFTDDGEHAEFRMDIAAAYGEFSRVESYVRRLEMRRVQGLIELTDSVTLESPLPITLPVLCVSEPRIAPGEVQLRGKKGILRIIYDQSAVSVTSEVLTLDDTKLVNNWQRDHLYRLLFTFESESLTPVLKLRFMA